jgi:RNA methyltransferase, TrmH family
MPVPMLSKKEIKDIQSLFQKKFRDELGLFIAEGPKIVTELLQIIPQQVVKVYATDEWMQHNNKLVDEKVQLITELELEKISGLQTPNQVLAVLQQFPQNEPAVTEGFYLYLDTIQDPGNLGTIIRIADWFGVTGIVCSAGCADIYNSKVVQSSMASIARVPLYYDMQLQWLPQQTVPIFAATLQGKPLTNSLKTPYGILIIGNESKGIRPELMAIATEQITIPRKGEAESLNAAVATGIILSHLLS